MVDGGCCASSGGWQRSDRSGALDLDLAVVDARGRLACGEQRRTAASGGGAARDRARGLGFVRKRHHGVARATTRPTRATRLARMLRRR
jgi:hypothetical protein